MDLLVQNKHVRDFITSLVEWREWVNSSCESAKRRVEIAKRYPGLKQNLNIYRSADGRVWDLKDPSWDHELRKPKVRMLVELVRDAFPQRYRESETQIPAKDIKFGSPGAILGDQVFTRPSYDSALDDEWSWEIPNPAYNDRRDDIDFACSNLAHSMKGLAFADALLAKQKEIEAHLVEDAKKYPSRRRDDVLRRATVDRDWDRLMKAIEIYKPEDLPDTGSISCQLHMALDRLAGVPEREITYSY